MYVQREKDWDFSNVYIAMVFVAFTEVIHVYVQREKDWDFSNVYIAMVFVAFTEVIHLVTGWLSCWPLLMMGNFELELTLDSKFVIWSTYYGQQR